MDFSSLTFLQKQYFDSGKTLPLSYRRAALATLAQAVQAAQPALYTALKTDLGKSEYEAHMCEVGLVLEEIRFLRRHINRWAAPKRVATPAAGWPAFSYTLAKPKGRTLILSPWNYPVLLTLEPLAGAIAAGCCAVVKPSAYAPATSRALAECIGAAFPSEYIQVVEGGRKENAALLEEPFDHIFFTGSAAVGQTVLEKAAKHLCPVTLELGGKSPCIVDETADLPNAARRIVFGKFLNCGQTCVAPDYILCNESVKEPLLRELTREILAQFGPKPLDNPHYGKIINQKHFQRLLNLLDGQAAVCGGSGRLETLQIEPTVLAGTTPDDPIMKEEIFGPILPVLTYHTVEEAITFINNRPHPLALYVFTRQRTFARRFLHECQFGGGCINDTIIHLTSSRLPFGGMGASGMGCYHGKYSFDTFSHTVSIVDRASFPDMPLRFQPYTARKQRLLRRIMR